jgi:hypothetical protein
MDLIEIGRPKGVKAAKEPKHRIRGAWYKVLDAYDSVNDLMARKEVKELRGKPVRPGSKRTFKNIDVIPL